MKEQRNLDGVYFRVQRDGKWQNICFTDLTEQEQMDVMKDWLPEQIDRLARLMFECLVSIDAELTSHERKKLCCGLAKLVYEMAETAGIEGGYDE